MNYFDAKRQIKKIYIVGVKAVKRQDHKYINYLTSVLEELRDKINSANSINSFGRQIIQKEIKYLNNFLFKNRGIK